MQNLKLLQLIIHKFTFQEKTEHTDDFGKSLEVMASLANFTWQDYTMFCLIILICFVVGFYVSFFKSPSSAQDYLLGGREMQALPVALSLIAR